MITIRYILKIIFAIGVILIIFGIGKLLKYTFSSCTGEGVDVEHYGKPSVIQIIAGLVVILLSVFIIKLL